MRGFLKVAGTIVVLLVSWVGIFVVVSVLLNDWPYQFWSRQIAVGDVVAVFLGYWFVHTGRLARMFRKV